MERFSQLLPQVQLVNLYGSTETTGDITCQIYENGQAIENARRFESEELSIGTPLYNCAVYVCDDETKEPVETGEIGMVFVSGMNVVQKYLSKSSKSEIAFVPNPFAAPLGSQFGSHFGSMYRTGDIGMINHKKQLVYLGRSDNQVKITGQRFNLQEIVVMATKLPTWKGKVRLEPIFLEKQSLIAVFYVLHQVGDKEQQESFEREMLQRCALFLPDFVLSRLRFAALQRFPLLASSGKLDRVELRKLAAQTNW